MRRTVLPTLPLAGLDWVILEFEPILSWNRFTRFNNTSNPHDHERKGRRKASSLKWTDKERLIEAQATKATEGHTKRQVHTFISSSATL